MSTRVRLPDGSYVNVQTDDPKAAAAAARKHWGQKAIPKQSTWSNFEDSVIDNVLPNWGDEIAGVGYGLGSVLSGKRSFGEGFREGQRRFKANQADYKKEHPTLSTVSAGTGMGLGMVLPAGKALKGASLGRKAIQGGKIAGIYGAASGAGEGDGLDLGRRASNAVHGAASAAVVGAGLPVAGAGAQRAGRFARRNIPGVDYAARQAARGVRSVVGAATGRRQAPMPSAGAQEANRIAGRAMTEGNIIRGPAMTGPAASPQAIEAEVAHRNSLGVPAMVGDTTEPMRNLTEWTSRGMGPGQTMVRQRLAARKATEGLRVRQHVQDTMPTVDDPIAFVEQQQRQARAAAAPLYQQAYSQPMYRTEPIQAIEQTPAFRSALPQTYDNIRNQIDPATGLPKRPSAMGFRDMPNADADGLPPNVPYFPHPDGTGYVAVDNGLSFEGYDQATRAMRDAGEAAGTMNPLTGQVRNNSNSVHINARANDLRQHLRDQNPAYDQAVGRYGDDMTYAQAFEQGNDFAGLTGHEVNAEARALPEQAHEAYATGAGTAMADAASQYGAKYPSGDTANHVRKMLGDETKQQSVANVGGNAANVGGLLDRLEYEHQGHLNWQGAYGNSRTASRQALDSDLNDQAGIPTSGRAVLGRLVDYVAAHAAPQYRSDVKEQIARIMTASQPASVQEALQAIAQTAEHDRHFADLMHTAGAGLAATAGANIAPIDPTQEP